MSEDLTNAQIALLCDIGEHHLSEATSDQKRDLERLVSRGYVEPVHGDPGSDFN